MAVLMTSILHSDGFSAEAREALSSPEKSPGACTGHKERDECHFSWVPSMNLLAFAIARVSGRCIRYYSQS